MTNPKGIQPGGHELSFTNPEEILKGTTTMGSGKHFTQEQVLDYLKAHGVLMRERFLTLVEVTIKNHGKTGPEQLGVLFDIANLKELHIRREELEKSLFD